MPDSRLAARDLLTPIGSTGLNRAGGQVDEEFLNDLRGIRAARIYQEMRDNDPMVGALLYAVESLSLQTPHDIEPDDDTPQAAEQAEFISDSLDRMDHTFDEWLTECLSMLPFGWALFEPCYRKRTDGRYEWRAMPIRAQTSLNAWEWDEDEQLIGFTQMPPPSYQLITIPRERFVLFRHRAHKDNPEGRSLLRNAYRPWKFLKLLQEYEAIGVERDATGIPVGEMPLEYIAALSDTSSPHASAARAMRDNVLQIRRGAREGILWPAEIGDDGKPTGFKLRPFMSGGSRQFNTGSIIERYEKRIVMSAMAEFLFVGMGSVGALSLASEKSALFASALGATLRNIESTFSRHMIGKLCEINGWPRLCSLRFGDIEQRGLSEVASALVPLIQSKAITPDDDLEAELRTMAGLPQKMEQTPSAREQTAEFSPDSQAEAEALGIV